MPTYTEKELANLCCETPSEWLHEKIYDRTSEEIEKGIMCNKKNEEFFPREARVLGEILFGPLEDVPLHINDEYPPLAVAAKWRLKIGK